MDAIRILRVIEYAGSPEAVARQVANSCHAEYRMPSGVTMRVATVDEAVRPFADLAFVGLPVINGYPGAQEG